MNNYSKQIEILSKRFFMDKSIVEECLNGVCSVEKITPTELLNNLGRNNKRIQMKHILTFEQGVLSEPELIQVEKYYVVYNTETNKEERTFNTLKEAHTYLWII
jgi:hypothetical protein